MRQLILIYQYHRITLDQSKHSKDQYFFLTQSRFYLSLRDLQLIQVNQNGHISLTNINKWIQKAMRNLALQLLCNYIFLFTARSERIYPPVVLMNNLYSPTIATTDSTTLTKVLNYTRFWRSVRPVYPVKKNVLTVVSIQPLNNTDIIIECGVKDALFLSQDTSIYYGGMSNTIGFSGSGRAISNKYNFAIGQKWQIGDKITMKINLLKGQQSVEFFVNDVSRGVPFSGIGDWNQIYFGMSMSAIFTSFKIVEHRIQKQRRL